MTNAHRGLLVAVLGVALAAPGPGAHGAAPRTEATCQGQTATIVGSPEDRTLTGTSGVDVIVSNGSQEVMAGDGDDVVCLAGRSRIEDEDPYLFVGGGPGDDHVTASAARWEFVIVSLGAGSDAFTGGRQSDLVAGGDLTYADEYVANDSEADVIDTGPTGHDLVLVGDRGPLADTVRVSSPGAEVRAYASGLAGSGSLTGDARSTLTVVDDSIGAGGAWTLDLPSGTASLDTDPVMSWTGFNRLVWAVAGTVDVHGTDGPDVVTGPVVSGDLGAGDDAVNAWSSKADHGTHAVPLDGGAGRDKVRFFAGALRGGGEGPPGGDLVPFSPTAVTVDVARQRTSFGDGEVVGLAGFEWYGAQTDRVATLIGSSGDDVLFGAACDLRMRGGAGDDTFRQVPNRESAGFTEPSCGDRGSGRVTRMSGGSGDDTASAQASHTTVMGGPGTDDLMGGRGRDRLAGGPGDDRLLGEDRADVLVGGPGQDLARGGRGEDTCRAEYGSTCELPRSATHLGPLPSGWHPSVVRLGDQRGDVSHHDDPRHPQEATPAPDVRAGDIVAVRTVYRHGQVTFIARLRSLRTTDELVVYLDLRYGDRTQYRYGDVTVTVPPHGAAHATARSEAGRCRPDLRVDRASAVVRVALDASSCLGGPPWVRVAVRSSTMDDAEAPSYVNVDVAPEQPGDTARYGPTAWAP